LNTPNIILGPPGTGKTKTLLDIIDAALKRGVSPEKIGFVSFTKKAVTEAKDRACEQFNYSQDDLPWFRTLHSMAYKLLRIQWGEMMQVGNYVDFGNMIGERVNYRYSPDSTIYEMPHGAQLLAVDQYARSIIQPVDKAWETLDSDTDQHECIRFSKAYKQYRDVQALMDFTDLLERYLKNGRVPALSLLLIDEAQDLSALQWRVVNKLASGALDVYIAGDDDQAIFRWAGADVEHFIGLQGNCTVLGQSWRLPRNIHTYALKMLSEMGNRREKAFHAVEEDGYVGRVDEMQSLPLDTGKWMLLCRHRHQVNAAVEAIMDAGYGYTTPWEDVRERESLLAAHAWETISKGGAIEGSDVRHIAKVIGPENADFIKWARDLYDDGGFQMYNMADLPGIKSTGPWFNVLSGMDPSDVAYLRAARRRGEKLLTEPPRIHISTIHQVKGGECDNVAVLPDITRRVADAMERTPSAWDDEWRVFYVAVTRARKRLYILERTGENGIDL